MACSNWFCPATPNFIFNKGLSTPKGCGPYCLLLYISLSTKLNHMACYFVQSPTQKFFESIYVSTVCQSTWSSNFGSIPSLSLAYSKLWQACLKSWNCHGGREKKSAHLSSSHIYFFYKYPSKDIIITWYTGST